MLRYGDRSVVLNDQSWPLQFGLTLAAQQTLASTHQPSTSPTDSNGQLNTPSAGTQELLPAKVSGLHLKLAPARPQVDGGVRGLQVRMSFEQVHDQKRGRRFVNVIQNGFPVRLLQLKPGSESAGGGLAGREGRFGQGRTNGHGFRIHDGLQVEDQENVHTRAQP